MSQTDDRNHPHLPVTAEVGSEGGSYSDPTHQVATFENDLPRTEGLGGTASTAGQALHRDTIAGGGMSSAPDPNHGMIRYPTEPPPSASQERGMSGPNWRAGVVGAAAGAAAVLGLEMLRRARRNRADRIPEPPPADSWR